MNLIYKVTNLIDGKNYIGQTTTSLEQRKKEHKYRASHKGSQTYFYNALNLYGYENFKWEIIEQDIEFSKLNEREEYWISYYKSNIKEFGYNMTKGGDNTDNLNRWREENPELASLEARKGWTKMRQILSENPEKEQIRKEKAKIGVQKYAKEHAEEIKQRSYQTYLLHKEAQEKTLQDSRKKRMKKVKCIETGIIYESINEAGRQTHNNPSNIKQCCDGLRKSAGKDNNNNKLHWEYA